MTLVGQPERATQNRVIALFRGELGYRYLGDWSDRDGNSNIEEGVLSKWLTRSGYTPEQISAALYRLRTEATNNSRSLYGNNEAVYKLLRYGVPVKTAAGELAKKPAECLEYIVVHELVHLLEPIHNARFLTLMDRFMPKWQLHRQVLNRLPVRQETWSY
jgi:metallopeptidase YgjP-like protein/type I restriction and modification enzyme subunit R-like protein